MNSSQQQVSDGRIGQLETLLAEKEQEAVYYRRIAEESGKNSLKQITELSEMVVERNRIMAELNQKVAELEKALAKVKLLEGIIPICMYCKKIRDDKDSWLQMERYIASHSEAEFSHGVCPHCFEEQMKKLEEEEMLDPSS
jgi:uncharacterized coiled-coil protein SlyX